MTHAIWMNLRAKNVARSTAFFKSFGFSLHRFNSGEDTARIRVGTKNIPVMHFKENVCGQIVQQDISPAIAITGVMFSFDVENGEEADEMATRVKATGGAIFSRSAAAPHWTYGFGCSYLDGHRWNRLHMDRSKMLQT